MNNTLESHKLFPIVAWALVIGFALFTYTLVMHLNAEMEGISSQVTDLETRVSNIEAKETKK
jgi:hypothetical protein